MEGGGGGETFKGLGREREARGSRKDQNERARERLDVLSTAEPPSSDERKPVHRSYKYNCS